MFQQIICDSYSAVNKVNRFILIDTCFNAIIASPTGSPNIIKYENYHAISNGITLISIIKHYKEINRNVSLNLAYYYGFLYNEGCNISKQFIYSHLDCSNKYPNINTKIYYNNTIQYIIDKRLIPKKSLNYVD